MGLTASLSMAGSEYLSTKTEGEGRPWQAAYSTGIAYVFSVVLLVAPFFILSSAFAAVATTIGITIFRTGNIGNIHNLLVSIDIFDNTHTLNNIFLNKHSKFC